ncbi:hypothetical protein DFH09DRAFT_1477983 [Mycena vulgaris]|nr:hypothetical protein DFH09DRAFT_1477983 [Mycena vulgaris]
MAEREKRIGSSARPGDIVNNAKQKRRTQAEIAADKAKEEKAKAAKEKAAKDKREAGVERGRLAEEKIRKQDERARATASRPDLVTAAVKRTLMEEAETEKLKDASSKAVPPSPTALEPRVDTPPKDDSIAGEGEDSQMGNPDDQMDPDGSDKPEAGGTGSDADYVPKSDGASESSADGDQDVDDEDEMQAQIAAFTKELLKKKQQAKAKATKPKKGWVPPLGTLRSEIRDAQQDQRAATGTKRKPADNIHKAAQGHVGWAKDKLAEGSWRLEAPEEIYEVLEPNRTIASVVSCICATEPGDVHGGEFDGDEEPAAVTAARAAKGSQGAAAASATSTAEMGIKLTKKTVVVDVNGKTKRETKPVYTNTDLPFPDDSRAVDLKHYQETFIPDIIDWAGSLDDPFAATSDPTFKATVRALKAMSDHLKSGDLLTVQSRRDWVSAQADDVAFIYREPNTMSGSYRSDLIIQTFVGHLRIALETDVSYGHPTGAMTICCAAVERALQLCKNGSPCNYTTS